MFTAFPEFSSLDIAHKDAYDKVISTYPPLSDLSFTTLMMWWNLDDALGVSSLNGNILFSYSAPDDAASSGISLAGTTDVDETIEIVFAELARQGLEKRLVHVPDFVIAEIRSKDKFQIIEERDYDEYVLPVKSLYPLVNIPEHTTRRKISKFVREAGGEENIRVASLDMERSDNRELLIECYKRWPAKSTHGGDQDWELAVIRKALENAQAWGIYNKCLFVKGEMVAFVLYQISAAGSCMILNHLRVNYAVPYAFIYMIYVCAAEAATMGVASVNMEMDLGIPGLRFFKSHIAPFNLLRKYTILPQNI